MSLENPIIIAWDESTYVHAMAQAAEDAVIVTSEEQLWKEVHHKPSGIVLLAELKWAGHQRSDFYGFELLCRLRTELRVACPVVVCSFLPRAVLVRRFPILEFPQNHPFIQLPTTPASVLDELAQAESANEPRLNDIIRSYCDPRARLRHLLTHGTGFRALLNGSEPPWDPLQVDLERLRAYTRAGLPLKEQQVLADTLPLLEDGIKERDAAQMRLLLRSLIGRLQR